MAQLKRLKRYRNVTRQTQTIVHHDRDAVSVVPGGTILAEVGGFIARMTHAFRPVEEHQQPKEASAPDAENGTVTGDEEPSANTQEPPDATTTADPAPQADGQASSKSSGSGKRAKVAVTPSK